MEAIADDDQGTPHQAGILPNQQHVLGIAAGVLLVRQQVAPRRAAAIDQRIPAYFARRRFQQIGGQGRFSIVDELMRDRRLLQPFARFLAGVAVVESVQDRCAGHCDGGLRPCT